MRHLTCPSSVPDACGPLANALDRRHPTNYVRACSHRGFASECSLREHPQPIQPASYSASFDRKTLHQWVVVEMSPTLPSPPPLSLHRWGDHVTAGRSAGRPDMMVMTFLVTTNYLMIATGDADDNSAERSEGGVARDVRGSLHFRGHHRRRKVTLQCLLSFFFLSFFLFFFLSFFLFLWAFFFYDAVVFLCQPLFVSATHPEMTGLSAHSKK